jgi:hypothetical protein
MIRIFLDRTHAKLIAQSCQPVEVCDSDGRVLGVIGPPLSPDEERCAEQSRRALASDQPRYTSEQVFAYLNTLAGQ